MSTSSLFDELKSKVIEALNLNKTFKAETRAELAKTPEKKQYNELINEIKKVFKRMDKASYGGKYISMRSGKSLSYDEFNEELKTIQNAPFKKLEDIDKALEAWTNLTRDELMTVRPLTDWFPIKVEQVKKVLRDVKIQDDVKEPEDLPEKWIVEFDDIPDDDGVEKVLKAVEDEISVLEESYGAPILDLLVRAIKVRRARGERTLPDVESKQDMIEVVSDDGALPVSGVGEHRRASALPVSGAGTLPISDDVTLPVTEPVAEPVAELESLGFSLEPIIPDTMIDYNEVVVKKDEPFKDINFANMTLNQIQAYKEMLSQVPDAESTWLQSFDDSTARGYQDRKTANEIREAYMWDQGFGDPSASKSEDYGGYAEQEYKDMAKILRFGKMQYAIDDYNERFYDSPDNFKSVRVPPRWLEDPVDEREFFRAGQSQQDETIGIFEDTYEVAGSQYGGFEVK
jgi:hypothetical protein